MLDFQGEDLGDEDSGEEIDDDDYDDYDDEEDEGTSRKKKRPSHGGFIIDEAGML